MDSSQGGEFSTGQQHQTWIGQSQGGDFACGENYYLQIVGDSSCLKNFLLFLISHFPIVFCNCAFCDSEINDFWGVGKGKSMQLAEKEFRMCFIKKSALWLPGGEGGRDKLGDWD